jgi:hypothetical protein
VPLVATVLGIVLTAAAGPGAIPLIIVGVVVAYLIKLGLEARWEPAPDRPRRRPGRP